MGKRKYEEIDAIHRRCATCGVIKNIEDFSIRKLHKTGRATTCKACSNKRVYDWSKNRPGAIREHQRKYNFVKRFGMDIEEYKKIALYPKNRCDSCGEPEKISGRKFVCIDHNHITKKFRGMLCGRCNTALGLLDDNLKKVRNLMYYLMRSEM